MNISKIKRNESGAIPNSFTSKLILYSCLNFGVHFISDVLLFYTAFSFYGQQIVSGMLAHLPEMEFVNRARSENLHTVLLAF